jgi:hypothetical protein
MLYVEYIHVENIKNFRYKDLPRYNIAGIVSSLSLCLCLSVSVSLLLLLLLLLLLMQLSCHSVAAVLTPVHTKQIRINTNKRNNTKTQYKQYKTQ